MMTLEQLLPELAGLSRADKLKVVESLTKELDDEDCLSSIEHHRNYDVWSPYDADEAAETLLDLLQATEPDDVGK